MRIAVLGGTGWVGRHVCPTLARHGHEVLVVARNPARHVAAHRFVGLDLASATTATIADLLRSQRVDVVVNATDSTNTTDGWERTEAEHALVNVALVERLLAAMGGLPWPVRIVQLGTIHEYGPVRPGTAIAETHPTVPANVYSRSKLGGSSAVLEAARNGVNGVVLRLVNLCGPHPSPDSFPGKLLRSLRAAGATEPVTVTITDARRDFVDVRDVAEAISAATGKPEAAGQVVNIGSGTAVEIGELVRTLAAAAELPPDRLILHCGPVPSVGGDWIQADITLAAKLLGWQPRIGLRESLRDMWRCAG